MRFALMVLALAAMLHEGRSNMVARCFPNWEFRRGSDQCYKMPLEHWEKTFNQAREYCQGHGGDSLIIKDQKTLDWVKSAMKNMGENEVVYTNAKKTDNTWKWLEDGSDVDTSLLPIDTEQSDGDCGALTKEGKLRGKECDSKQVFMCHRNIDDPPPCDYFNGWEQMFDHCYMRSIEKKLWDDSLSDCKRMGGSLITINNDTEQQFAKDFSHHDHEFIWIGMTEEGHAGTFTWVDGDESTYTHWGEGEPGTQYEGRGRGGIDGENDDGKWKVLDGSQEEMIYLCEKEQGACVYGWESFGDSCYYFNAEKTDSFVWENAKDTCAEVGAHLVIIDNEEENNFIKNHIEEDDFLWLGLKSTPYDDFYWINGSKMTFTHMLDTDKEEALQSEDEKCVEIQISESRPGGNIWRPSDCHLPRHYICEIKQGEPVKLIHHPTEKYCPSGWLMNDEKCYFFSEDELVSDDAREFCKQIESDLISINTWAEQDFIQNNIKESIYIGYSNADGSWEWVDGSPNDIQNWDEGEPYHSETMICAYLHVRSGKWEDWYCDYSTRFYGCERLASDSPFGPVTTTTTTTEGPIYSENCQGNDGIEWTENPNTGECYYVYLAGWDYHGAQEHCQKLDDSSEVTLLSLSTPEEYEFVIDWLQGQHLSEQTFLLGMKNGVPTIYWEDGTPAGFFNWDDGKPDTMEYCVEMFVETGKWTDVDCSDFQSFICEKKGLAYKPVEPPPPPSPTCPKGWVFFNFNCYYFYSTKVNWEAGKAWCESHLESSLASIMDSAENDFLNGMAKSMDQDLWIGLHDNDAGDDWHWIDGSNLEEYNNWNDTQPDNYGGAEHCGQLRPGLDGHWNDLSCDELKGAICKMTVDVCPVGWQYHDKKCYYASDIPSPFEDARGKCKEFNTNAELVTINNEEENSYFADIMPHGPLNVWIGYVFNIETQQWYWKGGSQSNYTNWNDGEPNNMDTEFCTEVIDDPDQPYYQRWNNVECSEARNFGCQYFPKHQIGCEDGWQEFDGSCITIVEEMKTYSEARNSCAALNAHLASIHTEEENSFMFSLLKHISEAVWLGVNDADHVGTFIWDDGSPFSFSSWIWISPHRNYEEPIGGWMKYDEDTWRRSSLDVQHNYACKKAAVAVEIDPKSECNDEDLYYRGSCYTVSDQKLSWDDAKRTCEENGTSLARIEDMYEGSFFTANLGDYGSDVWSDVRVHRYEDESVDFRFDDGQLVHYLPWDADQPDLNNGECIITTGTPEHSGYYRIATCDTQMNFVCEYDREGYTSPAPEPTPTHGTFCYDGWDHHDGHCYKVMKDSKTWQQGEIFCRSYGGHLASVNSEEEQNAIGGFIQLASINSSIYSVWVGLELDTLADKHWTDGSSIDYLSWDEDQPHMHDHENCASVNKDSVKLSCTVCESHLPFVCEAMEGSMISTITPPTLPPTQKCDDGEGDWYLFQEHCYKFVSEVEAVPESWQRSRELCSEEGSYLASITNIDENYFIESMFSKMSDTGLWVGGRATEDSGWAWVDGSPFTYENWFDGEPNHYLDQEDCIEMYNLRQGKWNDKNCGHSNARVCKRPNGATHPPIVPTLPTAGNCPADWVHVATTGRCFKFVEVLEHFDDASTACRNLHAHADLVSIHTPKELAYITAGIGLQDAKAWVGMKLEFNEYIWVDQSVVNYTPWAPGEPNGQFSGEECVEVLYPHGLMNDITCSNLGNYICAMKQDPDITEPSTFPTCEAPHDNYFNYKGECYRAEKTGKTWEEAEQSCASDGGHLASIENINQNAFSWILAQDSDTLNPWIGLNNKRDFKTYEWSDGWPAFYSNWGQDQPTVNSTDKNCVMIDSNDGLWYNEKCDDLRPFLCRYSEEVAPTPDPPVTGHCPEGDQWIDFKGGFCYMVVQHVISWSEASFECLLMDANLTSVHSESETAYLKKAIRNLKSNIWIGLIQKKSGLGWSDGTAFNFENWHDSEPSSEEDACTEFYVEDGTWNDLSCYDYRPFVCKTPKIPETEPTNPTVPPVHSTTDSSGGGVVQMPTLPAGPPVEIGGVDGLSGGAIFGIVVAVLFAFAVVGFVGVSFIKKKNENSSAYYRSNEIPYKADITDFETSTTDA